MPGADTDSSTDEVECPQDMDTYSDWSDGGDEKYQSLFTSKVFTSAEETFSFDAAEYGFDLRQFRDKEGLDQYETIKCINFVRQAVATGQRYEDVLDALANNLREKLSTEDLLKPVLEDDGLLLLDYEEQTETASSDRVQNEVAAPAPMLQELKRLQDENSALRDALCQLQQPEWLQDDGQKGTTNREANGLMASSDPSQPGRFEAASSNGLAGQHRGTELAPQLAGDAVRRIDRSYFESYGHFGIHKEMISDRARTGAYQQAIRVCLAARPGAAVLDVGCGTGILSMLAAEAGAARVIGVEASLGMAGMAEQICAANNLLAWQGGPIIIVAGQVEQLQELPVQQVDVLVSEWMGYALLFESMLDTVLHARDRWLKPGGAMLPDSASLWVAGAAPHSQDLDFWDSVYGFSMAPVRQALEADRLGHIAIAPVPPQHILTCSAQLQQFYLPTMMARDTDFSAEYRLEARCKEPSWCTAIALWFDVGFGSVGGSSSQTSVLSTSPFQAQTHWAQAILTLRDPILLQSASASTANDVSAFLQGRVSIARSPEHRNLDISLECTPLTADGCMKGEPQALAFDMAGQ